MHFSQTLIFWYNNNKRNLPWRLTNNVYHIWVSEIILQQTRVAQGTQYYNRFLERFPDIFSLADSDESEVLKVWQGLGYYSRARNMHAAARQIVTEYDGVFPSDYKNLIKIKGIGSYTASALLSFAYNLPFPVIDGNVKRLISRLFAIKQEINSPEATSLISEKLDKLFDKEHPAEFNQAIMEFGALQCKPGLPDCQSCVFKSICQAYKKNHVLKYPLSGKKPVESRRYFYFIVTFFYRKNNAFTFLQKRTGNDIWKNLYEFPLIEMDRIIPVKDILLHDDFRKIFPMKKIKVLSTSDPIIHKLTHQIIHARFILIEIEGSFKKIDLPEVMVSDLKLFPISRLVDKYLVSKNYFTS
jgi:A/G-specific adenine glycosylase